MSLKIRKGDTVQVIAGSEKGKKGSVIEVKPSSLKIKIQGVKVQTHFDKKDGLLKIVSNIKTIKKHYEKDNYFIYCYTSHCNKLF